LFTAVVTEVTKNEQLGHYELGKLSCIQHRSRLFMVVTGELISLHCILRANRSIVSPSLAIAATHCTRKILYEDVRPNSY